MFLVGLVPMPDISFCLHWVYISLVQLLLFSSPAYVTINSCYQLYFIMFSRYANTVLEIQLEREALSEW